MDKETIMKRAASAAFKNANGQVLRTINILREKYNKLEIVQSVLEDSGVGISSFTDAVNYLTLEGYVQIRRIDTHAPADIADTSFRDCEAKVTGKGIKLLAGSIKDDLIEV
ncbi:MAG: type VI secretion protein [Clostridia bacterium]|nr:type VI secretion protein [Clostridia bacterium]